MKTHRNTWILNASLSLYIYIEREKTTTWNYIVFYFTTNFVIARGNEANVREMVEMARQCSLSNDA